MGTSPLRSSCFLNSAGENFPKAATSTYLKPRRDGLVERGLHALRLLHVAEAVEFKTGRSVITLARAHVAGYGNAAGESQEYEHHHHQLRSFFHATGLQKIRVCFRPVR